MTSDLDRLYAELTTAGGITRTRDPRLELIAMDRALEARLTVGTEGAVGIPHPAQQLLARTFPHRAVPTASVHENAVWNYSASWQDDFVPQVVTAWTESLPHFENLTRASDTHWGIGYHIEPPTGIQQNNRYYVIAVFTTPLKPIVKRTVTFSTGPATAYQFGAMGQVLELKSVKSVGAESKFDLRAEIPGRGAHLRITKGGFTNYWVRESADAQAAPL